MVPLYSGGHDSLCATHVAARHPTSRGVVIHIDTTIGARATRQHVVRVCGEMGWKLEVWQSNFSYERYVRRLGFPGPGGHHWVYIHLKQKCVSKLVKGPGKKAFVTGCRSQESVRRMGHVEPVKMG